MMRKEMVPNLLTLGRVAAVPVSLLIMLLAPAQHFWLFMIFFLAAMSDFLDGYLARKWNVASAIGALLDPIADKLLVALMLLYLMVDYGLSLPPVSVIILRELYISGLREFLAKKQVELPVSRGGKLKTSLQLTGIALMLLGIWLGWSPATRLGENILWLAAAVTLATAIDYTRSSMKFLR